MQTQANWSRRSIGWGTSFTGLPGRKQQPWRKRRDSGYAQASGNIVLIRKDEEAARAFEYNIPGTEMRSGAEDQI